MATLTPEIMRKIVREELRDIKPTFIKEVSQEVFEELLRKQGIDPTNYISNQKTFAWAEKSRIDCERYADTVKIALLKQIAMSAFPSVLLAGVAFVYLYLKGVIP